MLARVYRAGRSLDGFWVSEKLDGVRARWDGERGRLTLLAFLVRAITPGTYELPGATMEDMYKPRFFARQTTGRITVHPAE